MEHKALKMIYDATGRYLENEENQALLNYAQDLPKRIEIAREVESKEKEVVKGTIEDVKVKYPKFDSFHELAWAKCFRDVQLVVRACVHAMIIDDVDYLERKTLIWLRTIFASFNFTPGLHKDTYTLLRDKMAQSLSKEANERMKPYFDRTISVLFDMPEPATPMV